MPFLWAARQRRAGTHKPARLYRANSIALLSNLEKEPLYPPSASWLGSGCDRGKARVRDSGLWNQNHVDETYDENFLNQFERMVEQAGRP
jgi:hypothetical protein